MATPGHHAANASPDTPITIKISLNDGSLKKLKLPLKDLGANVLIEKVSQPCSLSLARLVLLHLPCKPSSHHMLTLVL